MSAPGVEVVTDRRRLVLGGGLVLAFGVTALRAHARGQTPVDPTGPQPVSNEEVSAVVGRAFKGFAPGAFIRIGADGAIVLILPNVEMGQGVYTGEAALIAEELEVDLDQVLLQPAPPDETLYKQPLLQFQGTGGSTSIRGAWEPLRKAGAQARMMLIAAGEAQLGAPPGTCVARNGSVVHEPSGRALTYGALAEAAARLKPPEEIPLKPLSSFRYIGRPIHRLDTPSKANGSALYGADAVAPGMKHAAVANCPVLGGRLGRVDEAAALSTPGVIQVVRLPNAVAVVADNTWAAMKGLSALEPVWEEGSNARLSSAALWSSMLETHRAGPAAVAVSRGDVRQAWDSAGVRVSAVYRQPLLCHAPMEPMAALVHCRPGGEVEIWCGTQVPSRAQAAAARVAGTTVDRVVLHNMLIGGAFGRKLETDYVEQAVAIAMACPFPVRMLWSREQDTQHDNYRPMYLDEVRAALGDHGRPVSWTHRITGASVTARYAPAGMRPNGVDPDAVEEAEDQVYGAFPNMHVEYVQWRPPPGLTVSWWRGVGPTHSIFVVESFIDELAHRIGSDPLAYRRELLANQPRARAVLDACAADAGWGRPLPPRSGRGVAIQKSFASYLCAIVEVSVDPAGEVRLDRITAAVDCGLAVNPDLVRQQVEGGLIFGLTAALWQKITLRNGRVEQSNFHDYRMLRINETPPVHVRVLASEAAPGGIGETGTTAAAPALVNAIFAATGVRLREVPIDRTALRRKRPFAGRGGLPLLGAAGLRVALGGDDADDRADQGS